MTKTVLSKISADAVEAFRADFAGPVSVPGDSDYDEVRRVWSGTIDRRPALVARCTGVADVMRAVDFARTQHVLTAIRGGAHNVAGTGTCDGGLVIDLSPMKGIRVDPAARRVRAQPGVVWRELDRETQAFGLAVTGGLVSTTGIAGFTLGGGIGWLVRRCGMTCDNLIAADVVTADGQLVVANEMENTELLWGLRGGGGNFGVVTSLEYALHPVGPVIGGLVIYSAADARTVLSKYRTLVAGAPDELSTVVSLLSIPPVPFVPPDSHGKPAIAVLVCWSGPIPEGEAVVAPYRSLAQPIADVIGPMPYTAQQTMLDPLWPKGTLTYWRSGFLPELSDGAVDTLLDRAWPNGLTEIHLHHLGGAVARYGDDHAAYRNREAAFAYNLLARWADPAEDTSCRAWARSAHEAMERFGTGAAYLNFLPAEDEEPVRATFGADAYARLVALKDRYDPGNLFRLNHNIRPRG